MENNKREQIYLAALLHDIGKFYQRADTGATSSSKFLNRAKVLEQTILPNYQGRTTHKHCLWTAQFILDYEAVFKTLEKAEVNDLEDVESLLHLASCHHLSDSKLSFSGNIIKHADCLSSGMDRNSEEHFQDDQSNRNWDSFKNKRMISILETISLSEAECSKKKEWKHNPLKALELSDALFPQSSFDTAPDYAKLWTDFVNEFKFIQANTYRAFSETFLSLLHKYTQAIPSSTINFPDVSLYDHLKTTAALAICLYDFQEGKEDAENPFLLIGSDFSGIQSYIYQIVSNYAGKNLKGRSFYLKILSDTIVRYILKELNLFQANVVYNSGGSFYILAPNTTKVKRRLEQITLEIEKQLFTEHGTSLFVAIDFVEVSVKSLTHKEGQHLGMIWTQLFNKRNKKKQAKFASLLTSNYQEFFCPLMQGGDWERDSITGEELLPNEKRVKQGDLCLKLTTAKQIDIGKKLREADLLVISEEEINYWKDKVHISPCNLGFTYYLLNQQDIKEKKNELRASADKVSVITLNGKDGNCNFMQTIYGINNIYGLDFYGGNEFSEGKIATLEEMCDNDNFKRLGVLRMDVDNLGSIFQKGISPERATISRFSALSRSFDFFFSGYLNTIWRETNPERSFIIYSGGDDLFLVGSWDVCIELAEKIRAKFREFTCGNSVFSLSGGIAIVQSKFPLMKAAEESAVEESAAKAHTCKKQTKNAISFMDVPLNWEKEYPVVKQLKSEITELINAKLLPTSFLSKLLMHYANAKIKFTMQNGNKRKTITNYKTYWILTYDLSRFKERTKEVRIKKLIDNAITEICTNKKSLNGVSIESDYHNIELWAFACRWAELEVRSTR